MEAGLPGRSYQISPIETPSLPALLQGVRSTTPQGFGSACVRASSIAMVLHLWCKLRKAGCRVTNGAVAPSTVAGARVASVPSESTQAGVGCCRLFEFALRSQTERALAHALWDWSDSCFVRSGATGQLDEPPVAESLFNAASSSRGSMATTRLLELAVPTAGSSIVVETRR